MNANKENIRKWVEALRSGKYRQVRKTLANLQGYCCLGVACEVAIESGVKLRKTEGDDGTFDYDHADGELPSKVALWLGLTHENSYGEQLPMTDPILEGNQSRSAIAWNDVLEADFPTIADLIEKTFL